ncbi:MAG: outer membrane protein assembly factor BamA [Dokdonella sp.]|nr:outer membrane protein assembly factor BamA [Dokdonella sp.]MCB1569969.1 outer membrane protein assembly factor BamA [Xanthomonadales bacterium]MCB1572722.1 outer membrane protein assembly factor BamA [Xanthomonadales bacterium]MCB1576625.1 outer membrane protein assembly factor BamA [Xanthomonadales bacterium]
MKRIAALLLLAWLSTQNAFAFDTFTVSDIRIDGLSRIAPGTVFTYLPVEKGDVLTPDRAEQAIRALYKTGFFNDVSLSRQGDILVVTIVERPSISKIAIRGNKDLKDEDLRNGLKGIGLAEGETFNRLKLDSVQQELTRQYYNRGKYNVSVKTSVVNLDRNRVEVAINIAEGKPAKISHLNIVGNETFKTKKILEDFQSDTTNWTSWYSKDDQYSREKMSGDLERLSSFYLDRGYVDFSVDSTQVSMSPDKRKMYVVANIKEGEVYSVTDIKLTGDLILKDEDLRKLLQIKSGEIFSRRKVEQSADAITSALSNIGYAFAEVNPIPEIDREKREVSLNFQVVPGQRVYVRRITFKGNLHTEDQVLRREMRQLEGAWYSQAAIDRSKIRLQRLGYFKTVTIDTPRVPGQEDQVDVAVTIEEQPSGSFTFGVGYSQVQGLITSIALQQNNFFGTGDRVGLTLQRSSYLKTYSISYFEPYLTDDSIGLGYDISHRELDSGQANIANYLTNSDNFSTYVGLPLTESDTLNTRIGLSKTTIRTFNGTTPQVFIDYLRALNHNTFHTGSLEFSWAHDTRNKFYNPTRGSLQTVSFETTLPGSTVEYFKFRYLYSQYIPITDKLTFFGSASLGYGGSYKGVYRTGVDNGQDPPVVTEYGARGLPFFENFFAGGSSDVRGFRDNTLGPVDFTGGFRQPLGGAFKTVATAEIIFPTPFVKENDTTTRLSWFVDVGNVFKDYNAWSAKELRASTGLSFQWRAPIGPIIISFSKPLRKKPGDETESIQFTFGPQF